MKRKLFNSFVFLALLTAISAIFVFNSSAAGYAKQGDFTYYIDGAKAMVTKYDGNAEKVTVPSKVGSAIRPSGLKRTSRLLPCRQQSLQ